jgi:hypothetical protein
MRWYAHLWLAGSLLIAIALLAVLSTSLGGGAFPLIFAVVVGLPVFLFARRSARRHYERSHSR